MGKWRGRRILEMLANGLMTIRGLDAMFDAPDGGVRCTCRALARRGLLSISEGVCEITEQGRIWLRSGQKVAGPVRAQTTRATTLRARAWRAMRLKRKFSVDDLLSLVADGTEKDAVRDLQRYIRTLEDAGYLVRMRSGQWMLPLERDTGPEAPTWNSQTRMVKDGNTGAMVKVAPRLRKTTQRSES
ncbi:hypothetical protein SAMN05660653_00152 [Desulfonatronum thiosulfatophilum]|uniref:Uncharacterized protein n=1 Tax=Desulfonatronum thiosulfatophilum TaxID=617002 RepID=A0A1G6A5X6_9BACT|nr:hypothetical protein [Desulfonatronum thiosulfatophilum]SDB03433.1 hypothetical protein SAMN05660653_00152 [Desulfonatronum thiosulfatophilum]